MFRTRVEEKINIWRGDKCSRLKKMNYIKR